MSAGHISHIDAENSEIRRRVADAWRFQSVGKALDVASDLIREFRKRCNSEAADACFTELLNGIEDLRKDSGLNTLVSGSDL